MASVQELLLALEGKKSPFVSLLEGVGAGVSNAQDTAFENAKNLIALEQNRQEEIRRAEMDKQFQMDMKIQDDAALAQKQKGLTPPSPVLPAQKFEREWSVDEKGNKSYKIKTPTPKDVTFSSREYQDDTGKNRIGKLNQSTGEIIMSPTDPLAPKTGEGVSPSLAYTMEKDKEKAVTEAKSKVIPGYTPTGKVEVGDTEVRKLRDGVAEFETFEESLKAYRALITKHGTSEISDRAVQGQMEALAKNLQLKVKNLAQLGVLSASDIPFIVEQVSDPAIFATKGGSIGRLDTVEKIMRSSIEKKLKVSGYAKEGGDATNTGSNVSDTSTRFLKTATNPTTGERMGFNGKAWVPMP